ncbi:Hypothetical protein NTJ_15747 [Nesidiocoris tenuis]|uniref:Peptidase S1 domain-containing protein n=2 Tax=Nesidiocoris tenuis TaxID=355587 RepID=A0ABN7BEY2_9HEMI|nr:Hypothetical protein NTJ_15747 [Nesidiocoris tenuis]
MFLPIIAVIGTLTAMVQSCSLLSGRSELSWVVSIHRNSTKEVLCVGHIITKSFVFSFVDCYYRSAYVYLKGKDVYVTAGWKDGLCMQVRNGKKVMAHPDYRKNQHVYNVAILETENLDLDPENPPVIPLPKSEEENTANLADLMKRKNSCLIATLTPGLSLKEFDRRLPLSIHRFEKEFNNETLDKIEYGICKKNYTLLTRESCWIDHYCPSGNLGCLPFFQNSRTFVCTELVKDEACRTDWLGAPVICGDQIVGLVKQCMTHRLVPLVISGINDAHLQAIELYRNISKSEHNYQQDSMQKDDFPIDSEINPMNTFRRA